MSLRFQAPYKATWQRIYATVCQIPYGRVATYGQVAWRTRQCTAQIVGHALAGLEADSDVPAHRVVNARGEISQRRGKGAERQRQRLLAEGVHFDKKGRIDLKRYGYFPVSRGHAGRMPSSAQTPPSTSSSQQPGTSRYTVPSSHQAPLLMEQPAHPSRGASPRTAAGTLICELCGTEYASGLTSCPACGVGAAVDVPLPIGTELQGGKFTVGKVLGRGGFGITYKGAHRRLQRPVAIKELFPEFATRSGARVAVATSRTEGFRRE